MYDPDKTFEDIRRNYGQEPTVNEYIRKEFPPMESTATHVDQTPYGPTAQPVKPGINARGKAILGIGAAVLAGGSLLGYQMTSANSAENEAKAQEVQLQMQKLELDKLKEENRAREVNREAANKDAKARQASIDKCVKNALNKDNAGFRQVIVSTCQDQYAGQATTTDDLDTAASSQDASAGDGGINEGLVIAGSALGLGLVWLVRRRPQPEKTHYHGCHHP